MKKDSSGKRRMHGETVGIDLGDKVSRYCIVDRDGAVVEEGSFRNQVSSIEKRFAGEPRRIALEAGGQSAWIGRELKRLGHEVIVANARWRWGRPCCKRRCPVCSNRSTRSASGFATTTGASSRPPPRIRRASG